jgi:hypothetical protein
MPASTVLRRYWSGASARDLRTCLRQAHLSVEAFESATQAWGSLMQSWIQGANVVEYEHYPASDVVDPNTGAQFYFHAHRSHGQEYGHLHVYWHANAQGHRSRFNRQKRNFSDDMPTHLIAIALDARGLPLKLFTTNHWVTGGHWFSAEQTLRCIDRCRLHAVEGYEDSCIWLRHFLALYRPLIARVLQQRDAKIAKYPNLEVALNNRKLEVLSQCVIDWMSDLELLEQLVHQK